MKDPQPPGITVLATLRELIEALDAAGLPLALVVGGRLGTGWPCILTIRLPQVREGAHCTIARDGSGTLTIGHHTRTWPPGRGPRGLWSEALISWAWTAGFPRVGHCPTSSGDAIHA